MKIAHIIIGLKIGGAEIALKRLIEFQKDHSEIEHIVISLTDEGLLAKPLRDLNVTVYCLNVKSFLSAAFTFAKLVKLLKQIDPDIVQTWMYHSDFFGGLAALCAKKTKIIWSIRSTDITKGGSKLTIIIRRLLALLSFRIPTAILSVAYTSQEVHKNIGYDPSKMLVIANGFELEKIRSNCEGRSAVRNKLGISKSSKIVISVGRYNPVKDHETFIKAAGESIFEEKDVKFLLVGRGIEDTNGVLMSLIKKTKKENHFILLGERTDVFSLMNASDVFCLHSVTEGFPNVLGEAMALGLPCITTDVGDAALLLGQPEWVVSCRSPDLLTVKIREMLNISEAERKMFGKLAKARIEKNFTLKITSEAYLNLYRSLI